MTAPTRYTREELISICEAAIVPMEKWHDRDSPSTHERIGTCWALLRAGCEFEVHGPGDHPQTDERTIWLTVRYPGFMAFEMGTGDREYWEDELFYLPTRERLEKSAGKDWY